MIKVRIADDSNVASDFNPGRWYQNALYQYITKL